MRDLLDCYEVRGYVSASNIDLRKYEDESYEDYEARRDKFYRPKLSVQEEAAFRYLLKLGIIKRIWCYDWKENTEWIYQYTPEPYLVLGSKKYVVRRKED